MFPVFIGLVVVFATVFFFLKAGNSDRGKKVSKLPKTLQDPGVKYPLPLLEKEVSYEENTDWTDYTDTTDLASMLITLTVQVSRTLKDLGLILSVITCES